MTGISASALRRITAGLMAAVLMASVSVWIAAPAIAQPLEQPALRPLTGTLKRIKDNREVRLGVREAAVPFVSISGSGQPSGYSIDLCLAIVDDVAATLGVGALRVEYRKVTTVDRLDQVADGRIDLECGATTNTAERRERVAFSPPIFIAGTRLLVRRGSPVRSIADLAGARVAVVHGTTNEAAMRTWAADARRHLEIIVCDTYETALAKVAAGDVAALAADDVLLAGFVSEGDRRRQYSIVGGLLSYEPYGIVLAKDDRALAEAVHATITRLATSGDIRSIYARWFLRPLPSGSTLGWPMSAHLVRAFEVLGLPPE